MSKAYMSMTVGGPVVMNIPITGEFISHIIQQLNNRGLIQDYEKKRMWYVYRTHGPASFAAAVSRLGIKVVCTNKEGLYNAVFEEPTSKEAENTGCASIW